MARVLVAPDKFKGSLTAVEVADAVARGLRVVRPDVEVVCLPVADGGDGTLDAAVAAGYRRVDATATGPTGAPVPTAWAVRDGTAVVEMAKVSGLAQLPGGRPDPMAATSRGTGELVRQALDAGCTRVLLGIGGSACTDGGAGVASALGARLLDASGREIPDGGAGLADLASVDLSAVHPALAATEVVVACDVDNPLTGPTGAAHVYGPQKGATPGDVAVLDGALTHWADVVAAATGADHRDEPGAGAAGGVGFAALALLDARLQPGIDLVLELVEFRRHLRGVDLVITGEGSLDSQSLHGKAPVGVARAATAAGVPVVAVCGRRALDDENLRGAGIEAAYSLGDLEPDVARSMAHAAGLLESVAGMIAGRHLA